MTYSLSLVTAPTTEPVTVKELEDALGITEADQRTRLAGLIKTARVLWENYSGRKLLTQSWDLNLPDWPDEDYIEIPTAPLLSTPAVVVHYYDTSDVEYTLSSSDYSVRTADQYRPKLWLKDGESWPTTTLRDYDGVIAHLTLGYGATLPDNALHHAEAILRIAAYMYYHRGDEDVDIDSYVAALPCPDRLGIV